MMTKPYFIVSGIIFAIVATLHLVRVLNGWSFVFGPITISNLASWIAFVVTAAMCAWAIRLVVQKE